jgi:hypothetical protein
MRKDALMKKTVKLFALLLLTAKIACPRSLTIVSAPLPVSRKTG